VRLRLSTRCWWHSIRADRTPKDTRPSVLLPGLFYRVIRCTGDHASSVLARKLDHVIASGTPALLLVSRYSGIGKASVVNEHHKLLVKLSIGEWPPVPDLSLQDVRDYKVWPFGAFRD